MKKVLISLLVLAVAGGGAFAQGWTFNGLMAGGVGLFFDTEEDDPYFMSLTQDGAPVNFRTQLQSRFVNADGNAGLHFQIRGDNAHGAGSGVQAYFDFAYGWLTFMDDMITVYGGRVFPTQFNVLDRMHGFRSNAIGQGLLTVVRPIDGLSLGFGAFATGDYMFFDHDAAEGRDRQARFSFYARYDDPNGDFSVVAGLHNTNEHDAAPAGDARQWAGRHQPSNAFLSFAWTADEEMHLAFTARFRMLEDFGDYGMMNFYATFGHTGLVDNMDLRLGASFGMSQLDGEDDPHVWIWASVAYEFTDRIIPRLDLHYVMGGIWTHENNLHHWRARDGHTFDSDDMFIQIRPAVQLRTTAASFLEIGCIFHIDLGDNHTFGGHPLDNSMVFGLYAMMRVSF